MKSVNKTAVAVALGTVVVGSAFAVNAQTNLFGFEAMETGYQIVGSEGKCGEGKCGDEMKNAAGKANEGKCGAEMKNAAGKAHEGKCGAEMKNAAGKANEGKCGAEMKNAVDKVEVNTEAVKKEVK